MSFTWFAEQPLHTREQVMATIIAVGEELDVPDLRGASICAGMCVSQEAGANPGGRFEERQFWCPGNNADPCFAADPGRYRHDSMGNDGRSTGPYQQQTSPPGVPRPWGWGGLYGDPEGTRKRMDLYESTKMFLTDLKKKGYNGRDSLTANNSIQRVQGSGKPDAYAQWWSDINRLYDRVAKQVAPQPGGGQVGWRGDPVWLPDVLRDEGLPIFVSQKVRSGAVTATWETSGGCSHTTPATTMRAGSPSPSIPPSAWLPSFICRAAARTPSVASAPPGMPVTAPGRGWAPTTPTLGPSASKQPTTAAAGRAPPSVLVASCAVRALRAWHRRDPAVPQEGLQFRHRPQGVGRGHAGQVGPRSHRHERVSPGHPAPHLPARSWQATAHPRRQQSVCVERNHMSNQEKFDQIHRETSTQQGPSRSFMADSGGNIDTPLGIAWNTDGNAWTLVMTEAYRLGVPFAVKVVEAVATRRCLQGHVRRQEPLLEGVWAGVLQGVGG